MNIGYFEVDLIKYIFNHLSRSVTHPNHMRCGTKKKNDYFTEWMFTSSCLCVDFTQSCVILCVLLTWRVRGRIKILNLTFWTHWHIRPSCLMCQDMIQAKGTDRSITALIGEPTLMGVNYAFHGTRQETVGRNWTSLLRITMSFGFFFFPCKSLKVTFVYFAL